VVPTGQTILDLATSVLTSLASATAAGSDGSPQPVPDSFRIAALETALLAMQKKQMFGYLAVQQQNASASQAAAPTPSAGAPPQAAAS
jgi:hypothetical protein